MKHQFVVHTNCTTPYCFICEGGLGLCAICNCLEGGLATECPGKKVSAEIQDDIYAGILDFYGGRWRSMEEEREVTVNY